METWRDLLVSGNNICTMKLTEYPNLNLFLKDIFPVIEENFISHYLLFLATDRLIQGKEKIYYGCTVKENRVIRIIYMHTDRGHYFFGITETKLSINRLSNGLSIRHIQNDSTLFGSTFIIDGFIKDKKLNFKNTKHRYYMSLKSCSLNFENVNGKLHLAQDQDFDSLTPLEMEFYKEEFNGKGVQTVEDVLTNLKNAIRCDCIYYWKVNDTITTLISITRLPGERIYIPNIYTIPECRNIGITKSALGTLLTEFLNSGNVEIGLNVKVSNESAIGLFRSLGMKIIYETGIYES